MDKKKPDLKLYHVRDYKNADGEDAGHFTEIGAAWASKDGKGYLVSADVPIALLPGEKFLLREPKEPASADA